MSAAVEDNIRVAPPRTFAGGLVATIVVAGVMYYGAPMMGKAIFMGAMPPAVASLIGHLAYGLVLSLIVPVSARR